MIGEPKERDMSCEVVIYCCIVEIVEIAGISIKVQTFLLDFMVVIGREIELLVSCLWRDDTTM